VSRADDGTADAHTTADETAGETSVDLSRPDERIAHERARYLEATTDLRAAEADAVAYAERAEPVSRAELVDRFHGAENSRQQKAWWENYVRPALREAGFEYERNVGWSR